jgi:4-aminobutyrate aminotransferase
MKNLYKYEKILLGETMESREGFTLAKAYNSTLVDYKGKKFIDFTSGWNVTNIGWKRDEIKNEIIKQFDKYPYAPMWCSTEVSVKLAQKLKKLLPKNLNTFFKTTGGTESNEVALKIARAYTAKKKIFSFYLEYHGQTFGSISLGNTSKTINAFEPLVPGFIKMPPPYCYKCPYNMSSPNTCNLQCLNNIRNIIEAEGDAAAIICEALFTCPGVFVLPSNFFAKLKKICEEFKMLLIIDEVGTGFGRTGKMFAFEHYNIQPDIVTFAKALSGGFGPIGAVATSRELANVMYGKGGTSTYGWHALSAIAAIKTLEIIEKEKLVEKSAKLGKYALDKLKTELEKIDIVGDIRGKGLEIGIELVNNKKAKLPNKIAAEKITKLCLENGLYIQWSGRTTTLMIMPPLIISKKEIDDGIDIIIKSIKMYIKESI